MKGQLIRYFIRNKILIVVITICCIHSLAFAGAKYPGGSIESYLSNRKSSIVGNIMSLFNDEKLRYVSSLISFFSLGDPNSDYPNTYEKVKQMDRGDFFLGLFTYDGKNWVISNRGNYATYGDYTSYVNKLTSIIQNTKMTFANSSMSGSNYKAKLMIGSLSGISSAWNARPDAKLQHKVMDAESSLKYAFRMKQQGLRHSVISHYIDELYEQKKEMHAFINLVSDLCDPNSLIFRNYDFSGFVVTSPPDILRGSCCYGIFKYEPITQTLRNHAIFLFEMNQRELTVLCVQASVMAWHSLLTTTTNELLLYHLNVTYNILQHFEK